MWLGKVMIGAEEGDCCRIDPNLKVGALAVRTLGIR